MASTDPADRARSAPAPRSASPRSASPRSGDNSAPRSSQDPAGPRRLLALGATLTVIGLVATLGQPDSLAGALALGGFVLTAYAVHRVGRLGPERRAL